MCTLYTVYIVYISVYINKHETRRVRINTEKNETLHKSKYIGEMIAFGMLISETNATKDSTVFNNTIIALNRIETTLAPIDAEIFQITTKTLVLSNDFIK